MFICFDDWTQVYVFYFVFLIEFTDTCVFSARDSDFATSFVGNPFTVTVGIGQRCSPHTQTGFQGTRCVVDPTVDHTTVMTCLMESWREREGEIERDRQSDIFITHHTLILLICCFFMYWICHIGEIKLKMWAVWKCLFMSYRAPSPSPAGWSWGSGVWESALEQKPSPQHLHQPRPHHRHCVTHKHTLFFMHFFQFFIFFLLQ